MNWEKGVEIVFGRRPMTAEGREKLARKTIASCVSVSHFPQAEASGSVVSLFDGMFGIVLPDRLNSPLRIVALAVGSGFVADERHIITNNHVVASVDEAEVQFMAQRVGNVIQRKSAKGVVVARDVVRDLAVLRVEEGNAPFPPLQFEKKGRVKVGQRVIAMKNPRVNTYMGSPAVVEDLGMIVSQEEAGRVTRNIMKLRAGAVEKGDSGSPVINERGKVVGVMRAKAEHDNTEGYAVPVEFVLSLLREARGKR